MITKDTLTMRIMMNAHSLPSWMFLDTLILMSFAYHADSLHIQSLETDELQYPSSMAECVVANGLSHEEPIEGGWPESTLMKQQCERLRLKHEQNLLDLNSLKRLLVGEDSQLDYVRLMLDTLNRIERSATLEDPEIGQKLEEFVEAEPDLRAKLLDLKALTDQPIDMKVILSGTGHEFVPKKPLGGQQPFHRLTYKMDKESTGNDPQVAARLTELDMQIRALVERGNRDGIETLWTLYREMESLLANRWPDHTAQGSEKYFKTLNEALDAIAQMVDQTTGLHEDQVVALEAGLIDRA